MTGIPRECKRLAEVDFPIATVSVFSAEEKKVFGSHPSMLNQWWARRPLGACRAMLLALLLPDPEDPKCPPDFKTHAREALSNSLEPIDSGDAALRERLLRFIGDFSSWDRSDDSGFTHTANSLIKAAYRTEVPLVVDPFAGGGSIPLEALRIGTDCFASDLNPVATLIEKVLLEDIPRGGETFLSGLRDFAPRLRTGVIGALSKYFPTDPDGSVPTAYVWARSVLCESPGCGAEIPLARSFWVCKKAGRKQALRYRIERPKGEPPLVVFELFSPRNDEEVPLGSVNRAKATCLACGVSLEPERVRAQLAQEHGGGDPRFDRNGQRSGGARLLAVVLDKPSRTGRSYRLPTEEDYRAVWRAQMDVARLRSVKTSTGMPLLPDEPLPPQGTLGFRVQRYGITRWSDLFTARQKLVLATIIAELQKATEQDKAVREAASFLVGRIADKDASLVAWDVGRETVGHVFSRQALPIVWDFVESSFAASERGLLGSALEILVSVAERQVKAVSRPGQVHLADARRSPLPDASASVWFTDPPYYDAIPYSDLSDFFLVWFKRALPEGSLVTDPFDRKNELSPKDRELVQDETKAVSGKPKDARFFEEGMAEAFAEGRRVLQEDGIGCVVFAHKTTEGWEALLSGIVRGGWVVTASWPIATERPGRLRSQNSAALATSIHLVCRPRNDHAPIGDWAEVARELPVRVRAWMDRLGREGIRGADMVFACVGPAMEVYSRYSKVVDAQDREIPLGGDPEASEPHLQGYLAKVWEVAGKLALEEVLGGGKAGSGSLEEDARLTALFLWTLQSTANGESGSEPSKNAVAPGAEADEEDTAASGTTAGYALVYDVARRFAQPLGIHLDTWEGRLIETDKGIVRLLSLEERARQLFGKEDVAALASSWDEGVRKGGRQTSLFPDEETATSPAPKKPGRRSPKVLVQDPTDGHSTGNRRTTTLDRLHAAMLLQKAGASAALRTFLEEERRRGPELERLATALSALYPQGSEERRLVEALSLAFPKK